MMHGEAWRVYVGGVSTLSRSRSCVFGLVSCTPKTSRDADHGRHDPVRGTR